MTCWQKIKQFLCDAAYVHSGAAHVEVIGIAVAVSQRLIEARPAATPQPQGDQP